MVVAVAASIWGGFTVMRNASAAGFLVYSRSDPDYPQKVDFVVTSTVVKNAPDDAIVYPGQPGASHDHTFSCSKAITAYSTPTSLYNQPTSCNLSRDFASYWTPTLYANGVRVNPYQSRAYYRAGTTNGGIVQPIPFGLRIVAGDAKATSAQKANIAGFQCRNLQDGNTIPKQSLPPNCPAGDFLEASVVFPNCWDGRNLDSADHKSHMSYAAPSAACDTAHPVRLPQLTYAQRYPTDAFRGKTLTIASMMPNSLYTLHADFMNAWDPAWMKFFVDNCIRKHTACETVSDGRLPPGTTLPAATPASALPGATITPPSDSTRPSTPTNLRVASKTTTSVSLAWSASTDNVGVTGYHIYRGGTMVGHSTGTSYTNTGLTASTSYSYTVRATDAANNLSYASAALSVTTASPDTTRPTVSLTAPTAGLTVVKGTPVVLSANASDNVKVTKVQFYGDGILLGTSTSTASPYRYTWNTTTAGAYAIVAKAYDAAGNVATSTTVNMTVTSQ
ncbi:MAG: hypothetical protein K0S68_108 [Candidatus Saccharibacteria bacterium]|nr:hypothetical protein [Candidatus Saccharibacteria bacterium]